MTRLTTKNKVNKNDGKDIEVHIENNKVNPKRQMIYVDNRNALGDTFIHTNEKSMSVHSSFMDCEDVSNDVTIEDETRQHSDFKCRTIRINIKTVHGDMNAEVKIFT